MRHRHECGRCEVKDEVIRDLRIEQERLHGDIRVLKAECKLLRDAVEAKG